MASLHWVRFDAGGTITAEHVREETRRSRESGVLLHAAAQLRWGDVSAARRLLESLGAVPEKLRPRLFMVSDAVAFATPGNLRGGAVDRAREAARELSPADARRYQSQFLAGVLRFPSPPLWAVSMRQAIARARAKADPTATLRRSLAGSDLLLRAFQVAVEADTKEAAGEAAREEVRDQLGLPDLKHLRVTRAEAGAELVSGGGGAAWTVTVVADIGAVVAERILASPERSRRARAAMGIVRKVASAREAQAKMRKDLEKEMKALRRVAGDRSTTVVVPPETVPRVDLEAFYREINNETEALRAALADIREEIVETGKSEEQRRREEEARRLALIETRNEAQKDLNEEKIKLTEAKKQLKAAGQAKTKAQQDLGTKSREKTQAEADRAAAESARTAQIDDDAQAMAGVEQKLNTVDDTIASFASDVSDKLNDVLRAQTVVV